MNCFNAQSGYTAIELLITLLLAAVLLAAAVPSFREATLNARLTGNLERLTSALRLAQSVAARSGENAFACATTDGSTCSDDTD